MSMGPPDYAMEETYKSGLDREPPKSNLSKNSWRFYSPAPGECVVRGGCGCHSCACVGAGSGGAACGCLNTVRSHSEEICMVYMI
jgi:hypothetical protein